MTELEKEGKQRTGMICIGILIFIVYGIIYQNMVSTDVGIVSMFSQGIKLLLMIGLLAEVYKGKKWAKILMIIVSIIGVFGSVYGYAFLEGSLIDKLPFLITACLYLVAIYHLGFAKSYKAYFAHQNRYDD